MELAKCRGLERADVIVNQSVGKSAQEVSELVQREVAPVRKRASREKIRVVKRSQVESDTPLLSASIDSGETGSSVSEPNYEIAFEADEEFMRLYREAKAIAGGKSVKEVLSKVLKDFTKRNSPKERIRRREKRGLISRPVTGRHIPAAVKDEVQVRDGLCCSYVSPDGRRCSEKSHLEFDHVRPFALGGESTSDNIRLLCRAHNQFAAERVFGRKFMEACRREQSPPC